MNFLSPRSLFLRSILVSTSGSSPEASLISPSSTNTTTFVPVRSIVITGNKEPYRW